MKPHTAMPRQYADGSRRLFLLAGGSLDIRSRVGLAAWRACGTGRIAWGSASARSRPCNRLQICVPSCCQAREDIAKPLPSVRSFRHASTLARETAECAATELRLTR